MNNDIILPMGKKVKYTKFKGTPEYSISILKYLQKKYKNLACVIIPKVKINYDLKHTDVSLRWVQNKGFKGNFSIPKNYWTYFQKCKNKEKRFIIFPFGFTCSNNLGHANYMIYDKKYKTLERFEPYGKSKRKCTNPCDIDIRIKNLFNGMLSDDDRKFVIKYYRPLDFLEVNSFQRIQENEKELTKKDPPGGFCVIWSCWYAELRLSNPDKNRNFLIKSAIKKIEECDDSFTEYIRNYAESVVKKVN